MVYSPTFLTAGRGCLWWQVMTLSSHCYDRVIFCCFLTLFVLGSTHLPLPLIFHMCIYTTTYCHFSSSLSPFPLPPIPPPIPPTTRTRTHTNAYLHRVRPSLLAQVLLFGSFGRESHERQDAVFHPPPSLCQCS